MALGCVGDGGDGGGGEEGARRGGREKLPKEGGFQPGVEEPEERGRGTKEGKKAPSKFCHKDGVAFHCFHKKVVKKVMPPFWKADENSVWEPKIFQSIFFFLIPFPPVGLMVVSQTVMSVACRRDTSVTRSKRVRIVSLSISFNHLIPNRVNK